MSSKAPSHGRRRETTGKWREALNKNGMDIAWLHLPRPCWPKGLCPRSKLWECRNPQRVELRQVCQVLVWWNMMKSSIPFLICFSYVCWGLANLGHSAGSSSFTPTASSSSSLWWANTNLGWPPPEIHPAVPSPTSHRHILSHNDSLDFCKPRLRKKKTLHTIAILQCKIARYDYSRMKHLWLGMMSQLKSRWSHYKVTIMTYLKFAVLDPLSYLSHLPKSHLNHISHRRICPIGPLRASEHHGGWERGWVQEDLQLPLDTQVLGDDGCEILHQLMAGG